MNEGIKAKKIRLIDHKGEQHGIVLTVDALAMAEGASLDLVEISVTKDGSVCKIMDYGKFRFKQRKQQQEARKKQKQTQIKEIKFRPGTDVGDYQVKLRNLIRFLENGDKTKVTIRFRGREMAHKDLGVELLKRLQEDLKEYGVVEQNANMQGRQMTMVLAPLKNKK